MNCQSFHCDHNKSLNVLVITIIIIEMIIFPCRNKLWTRWLFFFLPGEKMIAIMMMVVKWRSRWWYFLLHGQTMMMMIMILPPQGELISQNSRPGMILSGHSLVLQVSSFNVTCKRVKRRKYRHHRPTLHEKRSTSTTCTALPGISMEFPI